MNTPWGFADHVETIAEGIQKVSTPGHGGYKLDRKRNARVHPALRRKGGWYEEDAEAALVIVSFPFIFPDEERQAKALKDVKNTFPQSYEEWTGKVLQPGESRNKDQAAFYKENANNWIAISATSGTSWNPVPEGFVKVTAAIGGRSLTPPYSLPTNTKDFLVPEKEYVQGPFGFVVDHTRYQECNSQETNSA